MVEATSARPPERPSSGSEVGVATCLDTFRTSKAYTIWEAARLAGISTQTAKRWLLGYDDSSGYVDPVFGAHAELPGARTAVPMLSFVQLVELVIVARFRKRPHPLKLDRIRAAHRFAREQWGLSYPFASMHLLKLGGHLLRVFDEEHPGSPSECMALDLGGQPTLPGLVQDELEHNLEFPDFFAGRWYPRGSSIPIVVDPYVAAGRPTIKGTGVTVATVSARWHGGESLKSLARDYGLSVDVLDQVLHVADIAA